MRLAIVTLLLLMVAGPSYGQETILKQYMKCGICVETDSAFVLETDMDLHGADCLGPDCYGTWLEITLAMSDDYIRSLHVKGTHHGKCGEDAQLERRFVEREKFQAVFERVAVPDPSLQEMLVFHDVRGGRVIALSSKTLLYYEDVDLLLPFSLGLVNTEGTSSDEDIAGSNWPVQSSKVLQMEFCND